MINTNTTANLPSLYQMLSPMGDIIRKHPLPLRTQKIGASVESPKSNWAANDIPSSIKATTPQIISHPLLLNQPEFLNAANDPIYGETQSTLPPFSAMSAVSLSLATFDALQSPPITHHALNFFETIKQLSPELGRGISSADVLSILKTIDVKNLQSLLQNASPNDMAAQLGLIVAAVTEKTGINPLNLVNIEVAGQIGDFAIKGIILALINTASWFGTLGLEALVRKIVNQTKTSNPTKQKINKIAKTTRLALIVVFALLSYVLVGGSLAALGIGAALASGVAAYVSKDFISNVMSYFTLKLNRNYDVGDYVTVGKHSGYILARDLQYTMLVNFEKADEVLPADQKPTMEIIKKDLIPVIHYLPNAELAKGPVITIPELKLSKAERTNLMLLIDKPIDPDNGPI